MMQGTEPMRSLSVAREDAMLYASLLYYPDETILSVFVCSEMEWDDQLMRPVREGLDGQCVARRSMKTVETPDMLFGRGTECSWVIYEQCPGQAVTHDCSLTRYDKRTEAITGWLASAV